MGIPDKQDIPETKLSIHDHRYQAYRVERADASTSPGGPQGFSALVVSQGSRNPKGSLRYDRLQ